MNLIKRKYTKVVSRVVLVLAYSFFFAIHGSARYYTVANAFVYGNRSAAAQRALVRPDKGGPLSVGVRPLSVRGHLSVDKRFQYQPVFKVPVLYSPITPFYTIIRTRYFTPVPDSLFPRTVPSPSLRGPPCA